MADNSTLPVNGGGTEVFANDDVGGVKYPRAKLVWGPDGSANDADVASGKPLPVQQRAADGTAAAMSTGNSDAGTPRNVLATNQPTLAMAPDTSVVANGASGTTLTPKFAKVSCSSSGANIVVAAVALKKIRVLAWDVMPNAAVNFKWQSHTLPTDLTGLYYCAAQGNGVARSYNPLGYFESDRKSVV